MFITKDTSLLKTASVSSSNTTSSSYQAYTKSKSLSLKSNDSYQVGDTVTLTIVCNYDIIYQAGFYINLYNQGSSYYHIYVTDATNVYIDNVLVQNYINTSADCYGNSCICNIGGSFDINGNYSILTKGTHVIKCICSSSSSKYYVPSTFSAQLSGSCYYTTDNNVASLLKSFSNYVY